MLHLSMPAAKVDCLMASLALTGVHEKLQSVSSGIALGPPYEFPPVHGCIFAPPGIVANRGGRI